MKYGKYHEDRAVRAYEQKMKDSGQTVEAKKIGLRICEQFPALGASVDGKVYDKSTESYGCLEVNCPMSRAGLTLEEAVQKKTFCLQTCDQDPPTAPTFRINSTPVSGTVKVARNNRLSVSCVSSGNPPPSYTWTYPNMTTTNGQELSVSKVQNNGKCTCDVRNSMNPSVGAVVPGNNTSFIDVLILYHPSIPIFNYWNTSGPNISKRELDVITGDTFRVACTSNGEPAPSYYWDNGGDNRILTINNITTDRSSICKARNTMQETVGQKSTRSATASLQIHVQNPPSNVILKYHYGDSSVVGITTTLNIREGNPLTVTCSSVSKPPPSYTWTGTVSSATATLKVDSAVRSHTGKITCNVENVMTRTFANPDKTKVGRASRSFNLQVLYPPIIDVLKNTSIAEGSPVTVSCPVTVGYPPQTTYEWIRIGEVWERKQTFTIDTTSRNDAMFYTCKVSNRMKKTGEQPVSQQDTKFFYLNVWYEATITSFFIKGHQGQTHVTVDENDGGIEFTCEVDSNPSSTVKITFNGEILKERSNTKLISLTHSSVVCLDGGEYTCEGRNQYGQLSRKSINLFVNCSPRPLHQMRQNITSARFVPVTLSFTALAYPQPGTKGFVWFKEHGENWSPVLSNADLHISSSATESNLTISNVSKADFGRYRLTVTNDLGSYVQYLFLEEDVVGKGGLSETCTRNCEMESGNTPVIIGISLGVVVAALAIYAASITILYKRKTTRQDQQVVVGEFTGKTYMNVAFNTDVPINQNNDVVEDEVARQYTDLADYSRDNRTTYEVLHNL
ncbi:hemicentin-1-like [Mercenaria mercenaria]|uniref:hemicentin-1-like n=1 Tax=Mercenaria mercenaria TaxID=6596 RepID=UPI00234E9D42|nr:hemicentin-1-like [Mercenaria mercenaria]